MKIKTRSSAILIISIMFASIAVTALIVRNNNIKSELEVNYEKYQNLLQEDEKSRKKEEEFSRPKTAVFIGDSYTAGAGASSPALNFVTLFSKNNDLLPFNLGKGGTGYPISFEPAPTKLSAKQIELNRYACGMTRCPNYFEILAEIQVQPDYVFINGGRNNALDNELNRSVPKYLSEVRKKFPKSRIYVTSPIGDTVEVGDNILQLRKILKSSLRQLFNAYYLDLRDPLLGTKKVVEDGVHPNDEGHQIIAERLSEAFRKSLQNGTKI